MLSHGSPAISRAGTGRGDALRIAAERYVCPSSSRCLRAFAAIAKRVIARLGVEATRDDGRIGPGDVEYSWRIAAPFYDTDPQGRRRPLTSALATSPSAACAGS